MFNLHFKDYVFLIVIAVVMMFVVGAFFILGGPTRPVLSTEGEAPTNMSVNGNGFSNSVVVPNNNQFKCNDLKFSATLPVTELSFVELDHEESINYIWASNERPQYVINCSHLTYPLTENSKNYLASDAEIRLNMMLGEIVKQYNVNLIDSKLINSSVPQLDFTVFDGKVSAYISGRILIIDDKDIMLMVWDVQKDRAKSLLSSFADSFQIVK